MAEQKQILVVEEADPSNTRMLLRLAKFNAVSFSCPMMAINHLSLMTELSNGYDLVIYLKNHDNDQDFELLKSITISRSLGKILCVDRTLQHWDSFAIPEENIHVCSSSALLTTVKKILASSGVIQDERPAADKKIVPMEFKASAGTAFAKNPVLISEIHE